MADPSLPPAQTPAAPRDLALLGDLAELGLRLAHALERHVLAAERAQAHVAETDPDAMILAAVDVAGVAAAYNRIARAVRMTVALKARLAAGPPRRGMAGVRSDARARDLRPSTGDAPEPAEHLFDRDDSGDPLEGSDIEILARICEDLGIAPDQAAEVLARWSRDPVANSAGGPAETVMVPPNVEGGFHAHRTVPGGGPAGQARSGAGPPG